MLINNGNGSFRDEADAFPVVGALQDSLGGSRDAFSLKIGVFATRKIKKGGHRLHVDLGGLPTYSLEELEHHPDGDHTDYVGHGKYVINHSPASFLNHSCEGRRKYVFV